MRKKGFIFLTIIILATLCLALVACNDTTDFNGSATITINMDQYYGEVSVYCPEGEIEKQTTLKYVVTLQNTKPVDVVLTCPSYETITLSYTTAKLKEGNITENVSFVDAFYKFAFIISDEEFDASKVKLAEEYEGVKLVTLDGSFVLESKNPIKHNIVLNAGDKYKNITLFKDSINYQGLNGKLKTGLPLIGKDEAKAVLYIPSKTNDIDELKICKVNEPKDIYSCETMYLGRYQKIDIADYYVTDRNDYSFLYGDLLMAEDLQDGYAYFESSITKDWFTYKYQAINNNSVDIRDTTFNCWKTSTNNWPQTYFIKTKEELKVGDSFTYEYYVYNQETGNGNYIKKVHVISEEEINTHLIDFANDKTIDAYNGRQFTLEFVYENGQAVDYDYFYYDGDRHEKNDIITFSYDNNSYYDNDNIYVELREKLYENYDHIVKSFYLSNVYLISAFAQNDDQVVNVVINVDDINNSDEYIKQYSDVTIEFYNIENKENPAFTANKRFYDGQMVNKENINYMIPDGYRSRYTIFDFDTMLYFKKIHGSTIKVYVVEKFSLTLRFTNFDIFVNNESWGVFSYGNQELTINPSYIENSMYTLEIPATMLGKNIEFIFTGYTRYTFVLQIPTKENLGNVIEVTLVEPDNEW